MMNVVLTLSGGLAAGWLGLVAARECLGGEEATCGSCLDCLRINTHWPA
jgi:hypothetical protein